MTIEEVFDPGLAPARRREAKLLHLRLWWLQNAPEPDPAAVAQLASNAKRETTRRTPA